MALTRQKLKNLLKNMGIEADKVEGIVEEVIDAHTETVDALKKERDDALAEAATYKADAEKLADVQTELDDLKADNSESYKAKYEKEHSDFEAYKTDVSTRETKAKKTEAFKKLLKDIGVSEKRIDAVVKVSAVDDVSFNEDGTVRDSDKLKDQLKKEWSGFIVKEDVRGAEVENPPAGKGGGGKMTLEQIDAIKDTAERQKAMLDNPDLFGL